MKNKLARKLIKAYQNGYSANTPPKCKYFPTCSNYALECYEKFNFFKASFLTIKRLLRCNPLSKGGYDPVPKTKKEKFLEIQEYNEMIKDKS